MLNTAAVLTVLVSTVLPLLSSLISSPVIAKRWPEYEGIATTVLAAVTGFVAEWANAGAGFDWKHAALLAGLSLLTAFAARARIWIGSALDARARAVGSKPAAPSDEDRAKFQRGVDDLVARQTELIAVLGRLSVTLDAPHRPMPGPHE